MAHCLKCGLPTCKKKKKKDFSPLDACHAAEYVFINKLPQTLPSISLFSCFFHSLPFCCDNSTWITPHGLSPITISVEESGISEINRTSKCFFSKCLACQGEDILQSSFSCSFFSLAHAAHSLVCCFVSV